jgi:hypothetical protein
MKYDAEFTHYIEQNELTLENFEKFLTEKGYVKFFNDITYSCLGNAQTLNKNPTKTTAALVYLPDMVKEKLITNFDILYVTQLYYGILTKGQLKFNYPNYENFLKELVALRIYLKKQMSDSNNHNDNQLKNILIKTYMNIVYGMLDKSESLIESELENPREYIVETSKQVMLTIVSFFLNKSMPIYYLDTDEIFVPHMTSTIKDELVQYFEKECGTIIDTAISTVVVDDDETNISAYILAKKKMIVANGKRTRTVGLDKVADEKVLVQNKKFFGRNYKDIFPEYALWA